jgi:outer membrane autotransporter protein
MNRTFKTIWSERANCFVAVSECTKGRGKRGALVRTAVALALAGATTASLAAAPGRFDGGTHDITDQTFQSTDGSTGVSGINGAQIVGSNVTIDITGANNMVDTPAGVKITRGSSATLSNSTITTNSYDAAGLRADIDANHSSPTTTQDASITATNVSITTSADHSHGAQALSVDGKDANATLTLDGGSITTHGDNSFGLHSVGEHSTLTSSATITTTGNAGFGAFAEDKANLILEGGTIHTQGLGLSKGTASLGLIAIDGAQITGTANVTTDGDHATGVQAETGAHIGLTDSAIQTHGTSADGVLALTGASVALNGGSVSTTGISGAAGMNTGEVRSYALAADGANSTIAATDTAVHATGMRSYGAYATQGGAIALDGGSVQTEGFMGYGVYASGEGSSVATTQTNISTSGQAGDAVWAYNGGVVNLNGGTIKVTGQQNPQPPGETANGLVAVGGGQSGGSPGSVTSGGVINAQGITLTTTGANSVGVLAGGTIGAAETYGAINLADSSITVTGANATAANAAYGSTLNAANSSLVSTQGIGIQLDEAASVALNNTVVQAARQSIYSTLSEAGKSQSITVGAGSNLTKNNGTLLQVDRSAQGGGAVKLDLQDGSTASGDIIDNANGVALDSDGGTYVTVGSKASFSGKVIGVRDFQTAAGTSGQTLTFDSGSQLGSLHISGDNTSTHGGTRAAPILASGDITVDNHAVFGGNWQIDGMLSSTNGGVIQPGNSVGTVSAGQINWGAGTVYNAEINAAGDSDLVNVTAGDADLSHTALHVSQENGNGGVKLNHDYKILTASGAITPFESTEFSGAPLIAATPGYSPNLVTVRLGVNQDALSAMDLSHNQRAAATGASSVVGANASADAAFLSDNPAPAFDQLSGEVHASAKSALMASADLLSNTVSQRLRGDLDADSPDGSQGVAGGTPLWAQVIGNWQTLDGKNGSADVDQDIYGLFLGGDTALGGGWRLGGAFGYTNSSVHVDDRSSRADVDSYTLGLYTGNSWAAGNGRINLMLGGGYTLHDIDTHRNVSIGGNQTLRSSYDADTAQVFGELGYELPVSHAASIEPYLRLAYLNQHTDSFDEDGGSAALRGGSSNEDTTSTTLGVHGKTAFDYRGKPVTLRASAGWRHAFGSLTPSSDLAFIQGGGTSFSVDGAPIAANAAVVELGAEIPLGRSNTVGLSYGGQFGDGNSDNSGNLYLKARF